MIDRLAELADIVPPRPVARPCASYACQGAAAWWPAALVLLAILVLAAAVLGRPLRAALRRRRARARLLRTCARLRAGPPDAPVAPLLSAVLDDLRRAGFPEPGIGDPARRPHQRLQYAREAGAAQLCDYLDQRLSAPRAGLRPARPPWGLSILGAARRLLSRAPRAGLRPARPPWGLSILGAARRLFLSAPRAGLRPARPPWGSSILGAARRLLKRP